MRKLLIGTMITAMMIVATSTGAFAQHRGHGHHRHNMAPWIVGGAVLGIIGAGMYGNHYRHREWALSPLWACWDERQPVVDYYDRIVGYRYVRVCN
jgi:heme/copper-type cytochrome/quinol oxidase subunit 3